MITIAARFERDRRRANVGWAIGIVALVALTAAFWPSIKGSTSFDELIADLPDNVKTLIGAHGAISLGTPPGYLNARLFAILLPALLTVYGIALGARALAGSERDGTLELILANPVSRRRVAAERGLAAAALVVAVGGVSFLALLVIGAPVGLLDGLSVPNLAAACSGVVALAGFHAAIAFAVGAAVGQPTVAVAGASAVAVAGYLLAGLLATTAGLDWLRAASPWNWLVERNVLVDGTPPVPPLLEVATGVALAVVGVARFTRRDLR